MSDWGAAIGAAGGIMAAAVTGWLVIGRERVTQRAPAEASAVDGFDKLTSRLEDEVARLRAELDAERVSCREQLEALRGELAQLRRELAAMRSNGGDRRRQNTGRPDGGPERRTT